MPRTTHRKSDVPTLTVSDSPSYPVVPLFPNATEDGDGPGRIAVTRVVPNDGFLLDTQELNITETWIKDHFGGGAYELTLYSQRGEAIGQPRRIKIAGPPLARAELESRARELKDGEVQAENLMQLQSRMFRENLEMLKAEAQAQRDRAKMDLEITIRSRQAEAEEREERERQRFEREMQRERERSERERQREKEAMAAAMAQQNQFMLAIQAMNKEQTNMMVAMIQSANSKQDPLEAAVKINSMVESRLELQQGDPQERNAQQMWGLVGKGLDAIAQTQTSGAAHQIEPPRSQGPAKAGPAAQRQSPPTGDLPIPQVVKQRLGNIFKMMAERGLDPVEVLKGIEEGDLAIVPTDDYEDGQDALKQLDDATDSGARPPRKKAPTVENPRRKNHPAADDAALGDDREGDGTPEAEAALGGVDEREGDPGEGPAGPDRSGAAVQSNQAQVPAGVS